VDKITLSGMLFYGTHGVYDEEAKLGQRFEVDVELFFNTARAARSDNISHTIHYGKVYEAVKKVVVERRYKLIEALATAIAVELLRVFALDALTVRVRKPHAPIQGVLSGVEVEIHRTKEWLATYDG
jgi:dihydroneopterin aldolase